MTSARLVSILANPAPICAYIGAIWRLFKSPANGTAGASENCPSMGDIKIKRACEPASPDDVDRLWPRRLSRDHANIDQWLKEVAPSDVLCKWFSHDPAKWSEFRRRYAQELQGSPALQELRELLRKVCHHPCCLRRQGAQQRRRAERAPCAGLRSCCHVRHAPPPAVSH